MDTIWINTMFWLVITLIFITSTLTINKLFRYKDKRIDKQTKELERIKKIKFKSILDQKNYLRTKTDLGQDFIYGVINLMLFFIGFRLLILPRIQSVLIGVISAVIFASLFAYFTASYILPKKYFTKNFVSTLLSISYVGSFIVYLKFFKTINVLILAVLMIIVMIFMTWIFRKVEVSEEKQKWL